MAGRVDAPGSLKLLGLGDLRSCLIAQVFCIGTQRVRSLGRNRDAFGIKLH